MTLLKILILITLEKEFGKFPKYFLLSFLFACLLVISYFANFTDILVSQGFGYVFSVFTTAFTLSLIFSLSGFITGFFGVVRSYYSFPEDFKKKYKKYFG